MNLTEAQKLIHDKFKTDYNTTKIIMKDKTIDISKSPTMIMIQEHKDTYVKSLEDYIKTFKDSEEDKIKENLIVVRERLKVQRALIEKFEETVNAQMLFHSTIQQSVNRLREAFIINDKGDVLVNSFLPLQEKVLEHVAKELTALAKYYNNRNGR